MWIHIQIIIYVLSVFFLPYFLAGGILKLVVPNVKSNVVAILATLSVAFVGHEYRLFGDILQLQMNRAGNSFDHLVELEKVGFDFYTLCLISYIPFFIGTLIIPFGFARLGVFVVNNIKKKKKQNEEDISNSDLPVLKTE